MRLNLQLFGGRGASSSVTSGYSLAVKENPSYKRELGKTRYAIQFRDGMRGRIVTVIDFNSDTRTDNKEKSLHSLGGYGNMKIYQKTGGSDIYLLTEKQMNRLNKKMPMRSEYEENRNKTMESIEKLAKQYADKIVKRKRR